MKPRSTLKSYFTKGAIPKESDFADLIDSMLVQDEDAVFKTANDPLSIKGTGAEEALLNFYRVDQGNNTLTWQLKQKPAGATKPGLSIGDSEGAHLFIESGSGNVGIGTSTPSARLEVSGTTSLNGGLTVNGQAKLSPVVAINREPIANQHLVITPTAGNIPFNVTDPNNSVNWLSVFSDGKVIMNGGNVGIGTANPGARLDVTASGNDNTTWGGWFEAIRFSQPLHSAITHPGGGLLFGMHSNRRFYFADTQRGQYVMMIKADTGHVGIGGIDPKYPLHISGGVPAGVNFPGHGTYPGSSLPICGLFIEGAGGASLMGWHVVSDARIKANPTPVDPVRSLATLVDLTLYEYEYIPECQPSLSGQKYHGFLAQEVEKVIPAAVSIIGDQTLGDDQVIEGLRVIDHDRIFGEAVGAIQALHAMVRQQEARIRELEERHAAD